MTVGRPRFHRLTVSRVEPLTDDSVAVTFCVPPDLLRGYTYFAGQHLTLRSEVDGQDLRRSYSICAPVSAYATGELRVAVKRLAGGVFSGWLHDHLRPGAELDVLTPLGHFGTQGGAATSGHHVAVAAGSGITPVLSILSTVLEQSPMSTATLLYGNQRGATVMFRDELSDLKDQYLQRFQLVHVLSREQQVAELLSGRLDPPRIGRLLDAFVPDDVAQWYLCGPHAMVTGARDLLSARGVPADRVHLELFYVEDVAPVRTPDEAVADSRAATVLVTLDGRTSEVAMRSRDESVLAATASQPRPVQLVPVAAPLPVPTAPGQPAPAPTVTTPPPTTTPPRPTMPPLVGPGDIVSVAGFMVNKSSAVPFGQMMTAADAAGLNLGGGAYRNPASQIALRRAHCGPTDYDIYDRPASQCSPPTARPGMSMHEQGLAIDFTCDGSLISSQTGVCWDWLATNAANYGFFNLPSEPWHWSVNGR